MSVVLVAFLEVFSPLTDADIFPLSSWNLFSVISNSRLTIEARVVGRNGKVVIDPVSLHEREETRSMMNSTDIYNFGHLGHALETGDAATARLAQRTLAHLFEPGDVVELVEVRFDPVRRYRLGELTVVRVLGRTTIAP